MQFATRIAGHLPLSGFLVGNWLSSDRPPLQTGFALLLWPLWHAGGRQLGYQLLATGLEACWLPALWVLLRVRGVRPAGLRGRARDGRHRGRVLQHRLRVAEDAGRRPRAGGLRDHRQPRRR